MDTASLPSLPMETLPSIPLAPSLPEMDTPSLPSTPFLPGTLMEFKPLDLYQDRLQLTIFSHSFDVGCAVVVISFSAFAYDFKFFTQVFVDVITRLSTEVSNLCCRLHQQYFLRSVTLYSTVLEYCCRQQRHQSYLRMDTSFISDEEPTLCSISLDL